MLPIRTSTMSGLSSRNTGRVGAEQHATASAKHVWAASRPTASDMLADGLSAPLIPFEELPLIKSERSTLSSCCIRWRFTATFFNRDQNLARGSLAIQVKRWLEHHGISDPCIGLSVNFPILRGRGRFVDVHVAASSMEVLAQAPLVFRGARLERHLVGLALSPSIMVVEVTGSNIADTGVAQQLADVLAPFAQVHNIWLETRSHSQDTSIRQSKMIALVETALSERGYCDWDNITAIPGYAVLNGRECRLDYVGRLDWCTFCRSQASSFHTSETCLKVPDKMWQTLHRGRE
ncbi:uncharacterized protein PAN0_003d1562 [Moesziomyces antarcticus]|uniref:Uncharacterized protein n=1 Tax=Pseudozyma antarctica TaxID=84753 RepID=A0A5C3FID2_PSEA2|nr:uncharacterized protein PAN0_003d1562 [Moesziomyces antarcticus]GAK63358.1 hypothetical protein PAN0_003d1562 [Moesziomyces antarcticus]SPO43940.1 uncharacterized protein PSANT_01625 [Moesziomyces antarcticus]